MPLNLLHLRARGTNPTMTVVAASAEPLRSSATLLVIVMRPVPAPVESASAETSSQTLPKTASSFPLMASAELGSIYLPGLRINRALSS